MKVHTKTLKKVLTVLLILILSFSLISVAFSAMFFRVLFPRKDTLPKFEISYSEIDKDAYLRKPLEIYSGKNRLNAYLYNAESPKAVVIVAGGIGADCDAHLPEILYFVDHDFSVLSFSATGVQKSEGRGIIGLSQPAVDLKAVIDYLREHLALPIVIYGHSAGAYAAALYADEEDVKGVVCMAGFDSSYELMYKSARERVSVLADIEYPFMCLENLFLFGGMGFERASENISRTDTPVMLVSGAYDQVVREEFSISSHSDEILNPNVTYVEIDSALRGTHTALWLSENSARYRIDCEDDSEIDKVKANKLDRGFMEEVLSFFQDAVS